MKAEAAVTETAIYDLIYLTDAPDYSRAWNEVSTTFPSATLNDESDYIHDHRFSVTITITEREWLKWLIHEGLMECSLCGNMAMMDGKHNEVLEEIIAELKAKKEGNSES